MANAKERKINPGRTAAKLLISLAAAIACSVMDGEGLSIYEVSEGYSVMFYLFIVFACMSGFHAATLATMLKIRLRKGSDIETGMLSVLYKVIAVIVAIFGVALIFGQLGSFAGFFSMFGGMMLGWSLQAPVSGIAAWVLVIVSRPYKIGDRIIFPNLGLMGDIIKFTPMYLTLNQVGGTVGSEEASGRILHVPNNLLFSTVAINTTFHQKDEESAYILDEAVFRVTFDSDWDTVEGILISAAKEATQDIIEKTGQEPYLRGETWDYGTLFRIRYMSDATDRPRILYEITKKATKSFQQNKNVDLVVPFVYSFKRHLDSSPLSSKGNEDLEQIKVEEILYDVEEAERIMLADKAEIDRIAKSIFDKGLLQPIVVSRNLDGGGYRLLFGEKRLLACIQLGWVRIPAIVRNRLGTDISDPPPVFPQF
ncbi:MAG: mechanosensitive ion channel [Oscillospiraceae bacterium]|nr:mechanosensitive ion channel [Oscillospiraceae bacterium]